MAHHELQLRGLHGIGEGVDAEVHLREQDVVGVYDVARTCHELVIVGYPAVGKFEIVHAIEVLV